MINKVILVGNVGEDPKIAKGDGWNISSFSIATSEKWTDKETGEVKENTEWHKIVTSGKLAEIVEKYARKGSQVYVEGKLKTRKYEKDGNDVYITEVYANVIKLLGRKSEGNQARQQATAAYEQPSINSDDMPF